MNSSTACPEQRCDSRLCESDPVPLRNRPLGKRQRSQTECSIRVVNVSQTELRPLDCRGTEILVSCRLTPARDAAQARTRASRDCRRISHAQNNPKHFQTIVAWTCRSNRRTAVVHVGSRLWAQRSVLMSLQGVCAKGRLMRTEMSRGENDWSQLWSLQ